MKKLLALILAAALTLPLVACGGGADTPTASPGETSSEEVSAPQETEEQEESTKAPQEGPVEEEPSEEIDGSVETEPAAKGDTKKSALYDENGNLVSIDEFVHEYQRLISEDALIIMDYTVTINKSEDNIRYHLYTHKDGDENGVQSKVFLGFANGDNEVTSNGVFDTVLLGAIDKYDNNDTWKLYQFVVTELMYAINSSSDKATYISIVTDGIEKSFSEEDHAYIVISNGVAYMFAYSPTGEDAALLLVAKNLS